MSIKKTNLLIALIIFINAIIFLLWLYQFNGKFSINAKQEYILGTIDEYCCVGLKLSYNKEPAEITIVSPSRRKYSKNYCDVYEIDESKKIITALIDTKEIGQWSVIINKKSNKSIQYEFVTAASPSLYLSNVKLTEIDGLPYLTFLPTMHAENETKCKYAISMRSDKKSFVLSNGDTPLNEQAYILIEPSKHAYTGDKYTIRLAIQSMDNEQSEHADLVIVLQDKSESIKTIDEEPNYNLEEPNNKENQQSNN